MKISGIIFMYAFFICMIVYGMWLWRSPKSDFFEQFCGSCCVIFAVLLLIGVSIGVLTGQI